MNTVAFYLLTFICTDTTLAQCEVDSIGPMTDRECETYADDIVRAGRILEADKVVLTYCTVNPAEAKELFGTEK